MSENPNELNDLELSRRTLRAVCLDTDAPAAARAQASRTLLDLGGYLRTSYNAEKKDLSSLSVKELDELIAKIEQA